VSSVNLHTREISVKVVYYGPGLGGKTSSLQFIHRALKPDSRGQLVSLATGVDRTLYFDFLPVRLPRLRGFAVRVQLYTVPGQVHYNSTRKLVLTGADGVVFVADSQRSRLAANVESLENLVENLREQGLALKSLPWVLQLNKRDAPDKVPVAELEAKLNAFKVPSFESVATTGTGVFDALKVVTTLVIGELRKRGSLERTPTNPPMEAVVVPAPAEAVPNIFDSGVTGKRRAQTQPHYGGATQQAAASPAPTSVTQEDSQSLTLSSLGEVADAIEKLSPDARSTSGPHRIPTGTPARALSDLLPPGSARDALGMVENDIERGDWNGALARASSLFHDLGSKLSGGMAKDRAEAAALAALLTGIPANRFLRFRELLARVDGRGAVTSADAIYALFFLCDLAMRAEEIKR
jgi:signal recognition particle receptor subunit beta